MSHLLRLSLALVLVLAPASYAAAAAKKAEAAVPADHDYTGAIVIDAGDGKVLFDDGADVTAYPASVTKLMNLLLCVEAIEGGRAHLEDRHTVTAEESRMGGSQVYLKDGEAFTFEDLLYAMMVQSANDAALACANQVSGDRDAFVAAMNARAAQLGMSHTKFTTPHGLASKGQDADTSTPRDIATLSREIILHPLALKFTSTKQRTFRQEPLLVMNNHNKLLWQMAGCDGLKTGYLARGGYALSATVCRDGKRVIAVVMGSRGVYGRQRDAIAKRLISEALPKASPLPAAMVPQEPEPEMVIPMGAEDAKVLPAEEGDEAEAAEVLPAEAGEATAPTEAGEPSGSEDQPSVHFRLPGTK